MGSPDPDRLRRATDRLSAGEWRQLNENDFWLQTHEVLTPYLLDSSYRHSLYVPVQVGHDHTLTQRLVDLLRTQTDPECLLVVGQYGAGKTSALHDVSNTLASQAAGAWVWVYFDANSHATSITIDRKSIVDALSSACSSFLEQFLRQCKSSKKEFWQDVIAFDQACARLRLASEETIQKRAPAFIDRITAAPQETLEVVLRYLVRRVGPFRVVLALDNLDPLPAEVQLAGVQLATQLCVSCKVKVVMAVRQSTSAKVRYNDEQTVRPVIRERATTPRMIEVIRRRIQQALQDPKAQDISLGRGALRASLRDSPEFADVLTNALSNPQVERLIEGLSNGSVREALHLALRVYNSHFIDAKRIIRKLSPAESLVPSMWSGHLPYYVVVKSLLLCNFPLYNPDVSWVGNIFGTRQSSDHVGPFLRQHIGEYLAAAPSSGITDEALRKDIGLLLDVDVPTIEAELKWLERNSWIEPSDDYRWGLSVRGRFMLGWTSDVEYLTHIASDVDMTPDRETRLIIPAERPEDRLSNLVVLLDYLNHAETIFRRHMAGKGMTADYTKKFGRRSQTLQMIDAAVQSLEGLRGDAFAQEDARSKNIGLLRERMRLIADRSEIPELIRRYARN